MTQIPSGWYPDPAPAPEGAPPGQRYWDGIQWTEHVAPGPFPGYAGLPERPAGQKTTPDGEPLAGWWPRVGASVLDTLVLVPVTVLLGWPFLTAYVREYTAYMDELMSQQPAVGAGLNPFGGMTVGIEQLVWLTLIGLLVGLAYHGSFLRWRGATPGKMVVGLRVRLREAPGQLPWSAIGLRLLVQNIATPLGLVPFASIVVGWFPLLDVLWPLWDGRNQALHDKAARTNVVVHRRQA